MLHPSLAMPIAFAAVAAGAWCNRRVVGWLPDDLPRPGRKQHGRPVPLAGILLLPAVAPWLAAAGEWWLLAAAVLATAVGFLDDRGKERESDLDWRWKTAGLALAAGCAATAVAPPDAAPWQWLLAAGLVFAVGNATNFLDNADGVAATLSAVSLLLLGRGEPAAAAAGFAALGFLPWNWPRSRLFLGDSGAYLLGVCAGAFAARQVMAQPLQLLCVGVQLADFTQVITARLVLGLPPWVGDRRHLTHIAQNVGVPRLWVAPLFAVVALSAAFATLVLAAARD
jgi:UDP-N-acetylmuramyl pentapeptide phosphotransferase/UDP-N-acetylglucosamine-1-phosphate transferase